MGKTEIARRLARLAEAPFLKVEASKFTEVGYVGRDVESMIRDLTELAVNMCKEDQKELVKQKAAEIGRGKSFWISFCLPGGTARASARQSMNTLRWCAPTWSTIPPATS